MHCRLGNHQRFGNISAYSEDLFKTIAIPIKQCADNSMANVYYPTSCFVRLNIMMYPPQTLSSPLPLLYVLSDTSLDSNRDAYLQQQSFPSSTSSLQDHNVLQQNTGPKEAQAEHIATGNAIDSCVVKQDSPTSVSTAPLVIRRDRSCQICDKVMKSNSNLRRHMLTHTGEKPHHCNVCQKRFARSNDLTVHMRVHTGEKPYLCTVCQKKFVTASHLKEHVRTHTGERPYQCNVCQRRFVQISSLTHHIRTHTGEKPYKCDVCQKMFSQKSSLTHHMRTHTGEKPYECDICQKRFPQVSSLTRHMAIHSRKMQP